MKERDVEKALATALEVFESPMAKEVVEYVKALLEADGKARKPVAIVIAQMDSLHHNPPRREVTIRQMDTTTQLTCDDLLYTELPRIKDHEFRGSVTMLTELAQKYSGTGQLRERLAIFLRDFEKVVRGEK